MPAEGLRTRLVPVAWSGPVASLAPGTSTGLVEGWMIVLIADRGSASPKVSGVFAVCSSLPSRLLSWGCCPPGPLFLPT